MESKTTVASLKALAHASRLGAYRALVQAGPAGMPVGALRDILDLPPATLTAHLNVLRRAGLVSDERESRVIRIRADFRRMHALVAYLTENCCGGVSCAPTGRRAAAHKRQLPQADSTPVRKRK
jgi:ArsR family transcriptional regulator, arsenate/arsenite/antimonite-responsive transcriptional repressor